MTPFSNTPTTVSRPCPDRVPKAPDRPRTTTVSLVPSPYGRDTLDGHDQPCPQPRPRQGTQSPAEHHLGGVQ